MNNKLNRTTTDTSKIKTHATRVWPCMSTARLKSSKW